MRTDNQMNCQVMTFLPRALARRKNVARIEEEPKKTKRKPTAFKTADFLFKRENIMSCA